MLCCNADAAVLLMQSEQQLRRGIDRVQSQQRAAIQQELKMKNLSMACAAEHVVSQQLEVLEKWAAVKVSWAVSHGMRKHFCMITYKLVGIAACVQTDLSQCFKDVMMWRKPFLAMLLRRCMLLKAQI